MYKRKRAGNTITRKINSTKDTAAKADKNHYISNSYLEGFIPIDTEYFTASFLLPALLVFEKSALLIMHFHCYYPEYFCILLRSNESFLNTFHIVPMKVITIISAKH